MYAETKLLDALTADDRALFEQIVGVPVESLLPEIRSLSSERYWSIFSVEKFLDWPELNRRGLHVFRTLLGTRLVEDAIRRHGLWDTPESREFRENGLLVRTDFLSPEDFERYRSTHQLPASTSADLARLVDCCVGNATFKGRLGIQRLEHDAADPQLDLHLDTFHPTVKFWYYLSDVSVEHGPLHIVAGSHVLTPEKLQWAFETSLIAGDRSHPEYVARCGKTGRRGSFGIDVGGDGRLPLERLGLEPEQPMLGRANTLFLVDTSGLHRRGVIAEGLVRETARGARRVSPFGNLHHPSRRRLTRIRDRASGALRSRLSGPSSVGASPS
jgi:hypothetical protein